MCLNHPRPMSHHIMPSHSTALGGVQCSSRYMEQLNEGWKVGYNGTLMADLSQDPSLSYNRSGPWVPALAKSSMSVCMSSKPPVFMTQAEVDYLMGFPSLTEQFPACKKYADTTLMDIHKLPLKSFRDLIGNGMHVAAMFTFVVNIMSLCMRRADLERLELPMGKAAAAEEEEESPTIE